METVENEHAAQSRKNLTDQECGENKREEVICGRGVSVAFSPFPITATDFNPNTGDCVELPDWVTHS
jgi:hypothetical protein